MGIVIKTEVVVNIIFVSNVLAEFSRHSSKHALTRQKLISIA